MSDQFAECSGFAQYSASAVTESMMTTLFGAFSSRYATISLISPFPDTVFLNESKVSAGPVVTHSVGTDVLLKYSSEKSLKSILLDIS